MKILVAAFSYYPNVDGVAGAAKRMVETFRAYGHDVYIATSTTALDNPDPLDEKDSIHRFNIDGFPALGEGFTGDILAYQTFILNLNPDLIILHCWQSWPAELARSLQSKIQSKYILVSHGFSAHLLDIRILPRGLWRWIRSLPYVLNLPKRLQQYDKVVFLSHKSDFKRFFDSWVARFTRCSNTIVIPNSIDTSNWNMIQANFRERENLGKGLIFLCVANYFPGKNQQAALDAFLEANIPSSVLLFIGSTLGIYGESVKQSWIQSKNQYPHLDVRFYENLKREEVIAATKSCDIAILASKAEAQPLTILEAMACGKPFICTNVGAVSELRGGIIVSTPAQMVTAIHEIASDHEDRLRKGIDAQNDFETRFSAEIVSQTWINLIEDIT